MKKYLSLLLLTLALSILGGCGGNDVNLDFTLAPSGEWTDGTYTKTVKGHKGDFDVTTTIEDGKIVDITVGDNKETISRGGLAIEKLPQEMIEAQGIDVDIVSGATRTSNALRSGVGQALEEASQEALSEDGE